MISDQHLDLIRVLALSDQEKIDRLPSLYPEMEVYYLASGSSASFGEWLLDVIERTDYSDRKQAATAKIWVQKLPSWKLLRYMGVVTDDRWLLHFTDEAAMYSIQHSGFTNGILDPNRLAFTIDSDTPRGKNGYLFAYDTTQEDYRRHLERRDPLFGLCAVMFKAPVVAVEYTGKEPENMVIFRPVDAHSFVFLDPVIRHGQYGVAANAESEEVALYMSENLPEVVAWVQENYESIKGDLIAPTESVAGSTQ